MIINKRNLTIKLCVVMLTLFILTLVLVALQNNAYADTKKYYPVEYYTQNDNLIDENGNEIDKTIRDFAADVKAAEAGTSFPELAKVIPRQYLESTETNAVYAYSGKEYGFYMTKTDDYFELLLIDFVLDDESLVNREFKIRIEPILQQTFLQSFVNGECIWQKCSWYHNKYYVANPRFVASLYNENALNYGDDGYSKYNDDGLIISQYRVNYGKVKYATKEDFDNTVDNAVIEFVADKCFDLACDVLDYFTENKGGKVLGAVAACIGLCKDLYNVGQETTVRSDNEQNITTRLSKNDQRDDASKDGYTRVAAFMPKKEIVLSDADSSYAELITVLDDTDYKSRLLRVCEFDIVRRDSNFGDPEYVTGANEDSRFSFFMNCAIYEDQQPHFEIDSNDFDMSAIPVFLFPDGNQIIKFTPKYSGEYSFELPKYTKLTLDDSAGSKFILQAGQTYTFKIVGTIGSKIIGSLRCTVQRYSDVESYSIGAHGNRLLCYIPNDNEYKQVVAINSNLKIGLLDEHLNTLVSADSNDLYYNFIEGKKYFFVIANNADISAQTKIMFTPLKEMFVGTTYEQLSQSKVISFTNKYSTAVYYKLTLTNAADAYITVSNIFGQFISAPYEPTENTKIYTFSLGANETYYICFCGNLTNTSATLAISPTQCKWKVGNSELAESTTKLKPNSTYSLEMDIYVDEVKIDTLKSFICYADGLDCNHTLGQLQIGNVANKERIILIPREVPDFGLTVVVDNMIRKITLQHCDGTNNYDEVSVELGTRIPTIAKPVRTGYSFLGYYTKENGKGKQYINSEMNGQKWNVDADNSTLYAHWQVNTYKINLVLSGDHSLYDTIEVQFDDYITYNREREHYWLIGIFSGPNQQGTRYVHSELRDAMLYYPHNVVGKKYISVSDKVRWNKPYNGTLYIEWSNYIANYTINTAATDSQGASVTAPSTFKVWLTSGYPVTLQAPEYEGYTFDHWVINNETFYAATLEYTFTLKLFTTSTAEIYNPNAAYVYIPGSIVAHYKQDNCVAEGTLITLADGTQVPVESLTGEESLLVWNMMTGQLDSAKILFIDKDAAQLYKVINLGFSDGTVVKVISEHAFWDCDLNEYVYLSYDASKYIGHWFAKQDGKAQLTSVEVREEYTATYSPVTYGHLCYYVNGMLSIPGGISGLFNIFEVDPETMTVDSEAMEQDISKYGLFTYEEFSAMLPVSQYVFDAFNGQYLKVAIGKGLIDMQTLTSLVQRYSVFFQ